MPPSPIHFVEGALASLDLARDTQPLLCRIIAFGRDDVVLAPHGRLDLLQHDALTRGEDAYLLLDAGRSPTASASASGGFSRAPTSWCRRPSRRSTAPARRG
jgi:hypothetical protein